MECETFRFGSECVSSIFGLSLWISFGGGRLWMREGCVIWAGCGGESDHERGPGVGTDNDVAGTM